MNSSFAYGVLFCMMAMISCRAESAEAMRRDLYEIKESNGGKATGKDAMAARKELFLSRQLHGKHYAGSMVMRPKGAKMMKPAKPVTRRRLSEIDATEPSSVNVGTKNDAMDARKELFVSRQLHGKHYAGSMVMKPKGAKMMKPTGAKMMKPGYRQLRAFRGERGNNKWE